MSRIHDQHCRCHRCKPSPAHGLHGRGLSSVVAPHRPLPPHVRTAMDRIAMAAIGLASVCTLCLIWSQP